MSQTLLPLLVGLLGAGAGITGAVLGPFVTSKRAHNTWVRDKRAELCETYVVLLDAAARDLQQYAFDDDPGPGLSLSFNPCASA